MSRVRKKNDDPEILLMPPFSVRITSIPCHFSQNSGALNPKLPFLDAEVLL